MPRDLALLKKIDYSSQSASMKQNIGTTGFVFSCYENDLQFTRGKQLRTTSGINKLIQSILKCLLTQKGTALEDPNYGADLESGIGDKMQLLAFSDMEANVTSALEYLAQMTSTSEDPDEVIGSVNMVSVVRDTIDPRTILVYIRVVTGSGKIVSVQMPQVS